MWAASAHSALAVQGGQAQPVLRSVRGSLPYDATAIAGLHFFFFFFPYNTYHGVTFCAMLFVIRAYFLWYIFCGVVVSCGAALPSFYSGWVASRNFLS